MVFTNTPKAPALYVPKPSKHVVTAHEFNNYMNNLALVGANHYACITELQTYFDTLATSGISENSIETVHLKNDAVTADKIADNSIQNTHLVQDAITWDKIAPGTFYWLLRKTYIRPQETLVFKGRKDDNGGVGYITIDNSTNAQGIIIYAWDETMNHESRQYVFFDDGYMINLSNVGVQEPATEANAGMHDMEGTYNYVKVYRDADGKLTVHYRRTASYQSSLPYSLF